MEPPAAATRSRTAAAEAEILADTQFSDQTESHCATADTGLADPPFYTYAQLIQQAVELDLRGSDRADYVREALTRQSEERKQIAKERATIEKERAAVEKERAKIEAKQAEERAKLAEIEVEKIRREAEIEGQRARSETEKICKETELAIVEAKHAEERTVKSQFELQHAQHLQ